MVNDDIMYVNHVGEMSRIMLVMLQKVVLRYLMCSVAIGSGWLDQVGWVVVSSLICGGFVWWQSRQCGEKQEFKMSLGYAEKLSYRADVGAVGMPELFDSATDLQSKVTLWVDIQSWILLLCIPLLPYHSLERELSGGLGTDCGHR